MYTVAVCNALAQRFISDLEKIMQKNQKEKTESGAVFVWGLTSPV